MVLLLIKQSGAVKGILTERDIVRNCIVGKKNIFNALVEEVMSQPIITINRKKSVIDSCKLMKEKNIKKIPVSDDENEIVGIITMTDIVHNVDKLFPGNETNALFIRDIMAKNVFYSDYNDLVVDVAALMKRVNVGSIIIMKKGVPVGVMTERDIVKSCVIGQKNFVLVKTNEIMSSPILTTDQSIPVVEAAHLMKRKNIKKIPIKNNANKIEGIITQTDIVHNIQSLIPK
ncbi:cyclic nucleotide-binding/CBS domain-containing protein [Nanoarchaeota archaeon]